MYIPVSLAKGDGFRTSIGSTGSAIGPLILMIMGIAFPARSSLRGRLMAPGFAPPGAVSPSTWVWVNGSYIFRRLYLTLVFLGLLFVHMPLV